MEKIVIDSEILEQIEGNSVIIAALYKGIDIGKEREREFQQEQLVREYNRGKAEGILEQQRTENEKTQKQLKLQKKKKNLAFYYFLSFIPLTIILYVMPQGWLSLTISLLFIFLCILTCLKIHDAYESKSLFVFPIVWTFICLFLGLKILTFPTIYNTGMKLLNKSFDLDSSKETLRKDSINVATKKS